MRINKLLLKENYKYVWLKYVSGIDLKQHCARCLIGEYEKSIHPGRNYFINVQLKEADFYYLCGVKAYKTNMHVAFRKKVGSKIVIDNEYFFVEIEDAEQILFSEKDIDVTLPESKIKEFNTCRNWHFANWLKKEMVKHGQTG